MTDERLAELAAEYEKLRQRIATVEAKKETLKQKICSELDRRGSKSVEHGGVKVTIARREDVRYDAEQLRERLSAPLFKRVTKPVVDKVALEEQVQKGRIDPDDVAACATVNVSSPWPLVTFPKR